MARLVDDVMMKVCCSCNIDKPTSSFYKNRTKKDGVQSLCIACAKLVDAKRSGDYTRNHRDYNLRKNFGISVDEYEALEVKQGGVCAICKKMESIPHTTGGNVKRLSVDHDHATGVVRGLLCGRCNTALGKFNDDVSQLEAAIAYLKGV